MLDDADTQRAIDELVADAEKLKVMAKLNEAIDLLTAAAGLFDVHLDRTMRERIIEIADELETRLDLIDPVPYLNPSNP